MKCPWCKKKDTLVETLEETDKSMIVTVACSEKQCGYFEIHSFSKKFLEKLKEKQKSGD